MFRPYPPAARRHVPLNFSISWALGLALIGAAAPVRAHMVEELSDQKLAKQGETRFGGLGLDVTLSDSSGLNAVGRNYRNELNLYFEPRWSVGRVFLADKSVWKKLSISARFVVSRGLSGTSGEYFSNEVRGGPLIPCSDLTPSDNGGVINPRDVRRCNPTPNGSRTDYSDISLGASLPRFVTIPRVQVDVSTGLRLTMPISEQSRFSTLRLGLSGSASFSRGFFDKKLRLGYSFGVTKNFHEYTTAGLDTADGGTAAETGGNGSSGIAGVGLSNLYADPTRIGMGGFNTSFSLSNGLSASFPITEKWSGNVAYSWSDGFSYSHRCVVDISGQSVDTCRTGQDVAAASGSEIESRAHRRGQVFSAGVSYELWPWLGLALSWTTWSPREKPDSSYRQPFYSFDYNAFTSVMLSASVSIEKLMDRNRPSPSR